MSINFFVSRFLDNKVIEFKKTYPENKNVIKASWIAVAVASAVSDLADLALGVILKLGSVLSLDKKRKRILNQRAFKEFDSFSKFFPHLSRYMKLVIEKKQSPPKRTPPKKESKDFPYLFRQTRDKLYRNAIRIAEKHNIKKSLTTFRLSDISKYQLDTESTPEYFEDKIPGDHQVKWEFSDKYYDYKNDGDEGKEVFWVDFANKYLGGPYFDCSWAQEEVMVAEIVDFAEHILEEEAKNGKETRTREGEDGVLQGVPNPYLMKGLHRVQAASGHHQAIELKTPQNANVLAMAAPCLSKRPLKGQADINTIKDLFNTFVAGFQLVKDNAVENGKKCVVNTGQIGAGVFGNHPVVVCILQYLAAQYVGIDEIKFWGYDEKLSHASTLLGIDLAYQVEKGTTINKILQTISSKFSIGKKK